MRRLRRIAALLLVNALGAAVGGELAALVLARAWLGMGRAAMATAKEDFLRRVPRPQGLQELSERIEEAPVMPDNIARELHPYFGFTYGRRHPVWKTNNFGFFSESDYPHWKAPDELAVGIFGGSVAIELRLPGPRRVLEERLLALAASKGYRKATVLMFAQGAWQQPQTTFCLLYYLDTLDVALVLDGFNEIGHLPMDRLQEPGYPFDFPAPTIYPALARRRLDARDVALRMEIADGRRVQIRLTERAARGLPGESMLVHLAWRSVIGVLDKRIAARTARLSSGSRTYENLLGSGATMESVRREFFDRYAGWVEIAHHVGRAHGKPVLHFVQPNQYVAGSKPYSDKEQERALRRRDWEGRVVEAYYPYLRQASAELRARGVPSEDLTMVFEDRPETLYRDDCCHINQAGMTLVAEAMARSVAISGLMEIVPDAGSSPPDDLRRLGRRQ